jgi:hypothetical protein
MRPNRVSEARHKYVVQHHYERVILDSESKLRE